jgi:4a-hydroxytetrahydrobiopterin dehydratase
MIMSTTPADDSLENISRILLQGEALESQLLAYPEWQIVYLDGTEANATGGSGMSAIKRTWSFDNFVAAFAFIQQVTDLAENYNHHPRCILEWGSASVMWWSHDMGGVTTSDLQMAALCDHLRI